MLLTEEQPDHFMVGSSVDVSGEDQSGVIKTVIQHTVEDESGERETHKRVIVELDDGREVNVGSSKVDVREGDAE